MRKFKIFILIIVVYLAASLFLPIFPHLIYGQEGGCGQPPPIDENGNELWSCETTSYYKWNIEKIQDYPIIDRQDILAQ